MRVQLAIGLGALLAGTTARADELQHPEDLGLGELAQLQDAAELQISAMPSRTRDGWRQDLGLELGITRWFQIAVGGGWAQGGEREVEVAAMVAPVQVAHAALAVGAGVSSEGEVEPMASVLVGAGRWGANLAGATTLEGNARGAAAVFVRVSRFTPLVEAGVGPEVAGRVGVAAQLGAFALMLAGGYGSETGPSAHLVLSWEVELAGDGDGGDEGGGDGDGAVRVGSAP